MKLRRCFEYMLSTRNIVLTATFVFHQHVVKRYNAYNGAANQRLKLTKL
jgi:hypothetical protein